MHEMNLYNAGRPLANLIDKVEHTFLAMDAANQKSTSA